MLADGGLAAANCKGESSVPDNSMLAVVAGGDMRLLLCPTAAVDIALGVCLFRWTLVGRRTNDETSKPVLTVNSILTSLDSSHGPAQ